MPSAATKSFEQAKETVLAANYSHSSFSNVQYTPNHSKYCILFFLVSINPPNYRTFSDF